MPPAIVIAPDSFKGSLSSPDAAHAIAAGLRRVWPDADCRCRPMADGGEGTLDALLATQGHPEVLAVTAADGRPAPARFGWLDDGRTAALEVAAVVGITDDAAMATPVAQRSTRGVGELVVHALDQGARRILVGLGGSSTNDGGAGLLAALGIGFFDAAGQPVAPTPEGLRTLARVDVSRLDARLAQVDLIVLTDVANPLCGPTGATAVFGPQKGVSAEEVVAIDQVLAHYATRLETALGRLAAAEPGAGAAGGLGFALRLAGGRLTSGAEAVADAIGLDAALAGADWALTGEGRSDHQTAFGKTPWAVARRARAAGVPVSLLSGGIDRAALPELGSVFAGCFSLTFGPATLAEAQADAAGLLADRAEQLARLWAVARR